jgi:UDPglucose 6-dehydrogenase
MFHPQVGIIGVGMVGGAMFNYFPEAVPYDIKLHPANKDRISDADIIFICVPTPYQKDGVGFDLSAVEDAFRIIKGQKIIVIKSTVWPGTTEKFQKMYPQHKVLFNPEFLRATNAREDFKNPDRQIIGYTKESQKIAQGVLELLPPAPFQRIIPAREAEMVKYFGNTFLALKVVFANQIYDVCQALGINYEIVREGAAADPRIGSSHTEIFHEGYRGYQGMCFPKDIQAFIQLADQLGVEVGLLKKAEEINNQLIKKD